MSTRIIENIGTIVVLLLGLAFGYVARHARRFQRCGRETLLCASAFVVAQAVIRSLSINGVITPTVARSLVSLSAAVCLSIVVQLALVKRKALQVEKEQ